jgi:hypothetical protein
MNLTSLEEAQFNGVGASKNQKLVKPINLPSP